jgi:endonuclease YncB( thermonuclease family)
MYQYKADFVRAVDGDTVELTVDLGFDIRVDTVFRLYGIDTPERGQVGWAEATAFVKSFFAKNPTVTINTYKKEKYGRWLAEVFAGTESLNKLLVDNNLAKVYLP